MVLSHFEEIPAFGRNSISGGYFQLLNLQVGPDLYLEKFQVGFGSPESGRLKLNTKSLRNLTKKYAFCSEPYLNSPSPKLGRANVFFKLIISENKLFCRICWDQLSGTRWKWNRIDLYNGSRRWIEMPIF